MTVLKRLPIIATVLAVICLMLPATPVAAANPVTVVLGGTGSSSWSISGIAPGDSGTKSVSVQNTGTGTGELRIWLSNLTGTEGTPAGFETPTPGDTGELAQYLTLRVQGSGLTSNITMPALPTAFPASAADASYIKATLGSGQTINLTWTWSLPAPTGNIVQGDGISFTINYTLNEVVAPPTTTTTAPPTTTTTTPPTTTIPPTTTTAPPTTTTTPPATTPPPTTTQPEPTPPGTTEPVPTTPITTAPLPTTAPPTTAAPTTRPPATTLPTTTPPVTSTAPTAPPTTAPSSQIAIRIFGSTQATGSVATDGRLKSSLIAASSKGDITLALPAGIRLVAEDGGLLDVIDVSLFQGTLPSIQGKMILGNIYELVGYDTSGHLTTFDSNLPFLLSLPFLQSDVPAGAQSVYIAYFDSATGQWSRLPSPDYSYPAPGQIQGILSHFSLYAVLADVSAPVHVPAASFEVGAPTVQPASIQAGKPVTISATITNTGDASGEFLVHAYIYGLLDTTELVTLAPGASQEVSFTVVPQSEGFYTAAINGKQATFTVTEAVDEVGEVRSFIRAHIGDYIGFAVVLMLVLGLAGAVILPAKRPC